MRGRTNCHFVYSMRVTISGQRVCALGDECMERIYNRVIMDDNTIIPIPYTIGSLLTVGFDGCVRPWYRDKGCRSQLNKGNQCLAFAPFTDQMEMASIIQGRR